MNMKVAAIAIVAASLVAAGTATAATRISDVDYLRASRCKGLAEGLSSDTTGVDALLKDAKRSRDQYIVERGEAEMKRAKREMQGDRKDKASAEFASACTAFMGPGRDVAVR
jgi:hypothetical protein